jgi:hypothetical protein
VLDHLADELDPEAAPAVLVEDVDVGEVDEAEADDGRGTAEADLPALVVQPDDADGRLDERALLVQRAALGPVRLLAQVAVDGDEVDPPRSSRAGRRDAGRYAIGASVTPTGSSGGSRRAPRTTT